MWPYIVTNFLIINQLDALFSNLFRNETLHVSDSSSVHHQELFPVRSAMVYVIKFCRQLSSRSRIRMELHYCCCSRVVYKPVWHIPSLSVQWITPDDGQRNCPKHVVLHSKINLKIVCLVGFIIWKLIPYSHVKSTMVKRLYLVFYTM
jgi:hypothetical protein